MIAPGKRQARVKGYKRTTIGNETFDSKREASRWMDLKLLERAGEISDLRRQVSIPLMGKDGPILTPTGRQAFYKADYTYRLTRSNETVVEDSKGFRTEIYKLKRAILKAQGITIKET